MKKEIVFHHITSVIRIFLFLAMMTGVSCYAKPTQAPQPERLAIAETEAMEESEVITYHPGGEEIPNRKDAIRVLIRYHSYGTLQERSIELNDPNFEHIVINTDHEISLEVYLNTDINKELYKKKGDKLEIVRLLDAHMNNALVPLWKTNRYVLKKEALMSGALYFVFEEDARILNQIISFPPLREWNFKQKIVVKQDYTNIIFIYVIAFGFLAFIIYVGISNFRGSKDKETNRYLSHLTSNLLKYASEESSREKDIFNDYLHDHPNIEITHDTYLDENKTGEYYTYLCQHLSFEERRDFILFLFKLAIDQDGIKNKEWSLLQQTMMGLRMNNITINYFNQKYGPLRTEYDDYARYHSSPKTSVTYSRALSSDYAALGITSTARKEEVQRAYHKMALQYHPDLPQNAGKEDFCTQKMTEINAAYDRIIDTFQ